MKKLFAAITAFACASAVFTGCGKTDDDEKTSGEQPAKSTEDEIKELLDEVLTAANNKDIEKIAGLCLPDELSETVFGMASDEINDFIDENDIIDDSGIEDSAEIISVKKTDDIDESYLSLYEKGCSAVMIVADYMKENNINVEDLASMDDEELYSIITDESLEGTPMGDLIGILESVENYDSFEEFISSAELDKIESRFDITDACMAEITIKTSDGEEESMEFPFYKVKDEGWNIEFIAYPAVIGYNAKKSKKKQKEAAVGQEQDKTDINSSASSLSKAASSALADMRSEGCDVGGMYIISSDPDDNYNVSDSFETEKFLSYAGEYFPEIEELDYFAVMKGGVCVYAACKNPADDDMLEFIGTYPANTVPHKTDKYSFKPAPYTSNADFTFRELYERAVEIIG